jgi:hypothetical protein
MPACHRAPTTAARTLPPGVADMLARSLALLALVASLAGCTLVDIRTDGHTGVTSDSFVSGYATLGWPDSNSLLRVDVLDGNSPGSILFIQLWKIAQVELGLLGASAGIGPVNAGIGIFFYEPEPPFDRYEQDDDCGKCPPCSTCEATGTHVHGPHVHKEPAAGGV